MFVTRISPWTGELNTMNLPVTQAQLDNYASGRVLLQDAFPHLSPPEREFIKSGYTPQDWNELFGVRPQGA